MARVTAASAEARLTEAALAVTARAAGRPWRAGAEATARAAPTAPVCAVLAAAGEDTTPDPRAIRLVPTPVPPPDTAADAGRTLRSALASRTCTVTAVPSARVSCLGK